MGEEQIILDPTIVYISTQSFEEVAVHYPCKITKIPSYLSRSSYGFGFAANSPYAKLFNVRLSQYKSYGI